MKTISKWSSLVVLILAVVCLTARYALCYWCGYYQKSWTPVGYQGLLALFGFILFPVQLTIWIVSLFQRRHRLWTTAMLAGLFALWGLKCVLPWPHDLILPAMRDGMLRNYGLDGIRHFAHDFDQLPNIPEHNLPGLTQKFYWNADLAKTGLKEKYPFLARCEAIVDADNKVHVDWGGFENHWGFSVSVNGKRIDPYLEPSNKIIRVSDDIYFKSDY